jgi:hypothetical protein
MSGHPRWDVVVAGAGNAALCAACAARQEGARVLVLEKAPRELRGGNTRFTTGAMRFAYSSPEDVLALIPDLSPVERANVEFNLRPGRVLQRPDASHRGLADPVFAASGLGVVPGDPLDDGLACASWAFQRAVQSGHRARFHAMIQSRAPSRASDWSSSPRVWRQSGTTRSSSDWCRTRAGAWSACVRRPDLRSAPVRSPAGGFEANRELRATWARSGTR